MRKEKEADRVKRKMGKIAEADSKVKKEVKGKTYTEKEITEALKEITASRGKRTTDRNKTIEQLKGLSLHAITPYLILKIRTVLTSALFEKNLNSVVFMPAKSWKDCYESVISLLDLLSKNKNVRLSEDENIRESFEEDEGYASMTAEALMEDEEEKKKREEEEEKKKREEQLRKEKENENPEIQYVSGNLFSYAQRLNAQYRKALQNIYYDTPEYICRLKDEPLLTNLLERAQLYYEEINKEVFIVQLKVLRLGLLFYRYDPKEDPEHEKYEGPDLKKLRTFDDKSFGKNNKIVHNLAAYLYEHGGERQKVQALLYHTYYLAQHGRYHEARHLLLMSHVQDAIDQADIPIRILFNRSMAQLGLCAFRVGDIENALGALCNLYNSNKIKELIAQVPRGMVRWNQKKDPEEEKLERSRQYPEHMHLNLDLLDACHLVSAMFVESANVALYGMDKKHIISKSFRRLMDNHSRQAFNGPPEDIRDTVMAISKQLKYGDWQKAYTYIERLDVWKMLQNKTKILLGLKKKIKEVALQTYLIYFSSQYKTIGVEYLMNMFELSEKDTYRICSELVTEDQLQGAWDHTSKCIVIDAKQPTKLQIDGTKYITKSESFLEQNERLLNQRFGTYNRRNAGGRGWTDFSANKNKRNNNYRKNNNNNRRNNNNNNRSGFRGGFGGRSGGFNSRSGGFNNRSSNFGNRTGGIRQWK